MDLLFQSVQLPLNILQFDKVVAPMFILFDAYRRMYRLGVSLELRSSFSVGLRLAIQLYTFKTRNTHVLCVRVPYSQAPPTK